VAFAPAQIATQLSAAVTASLLVENAADLGSAPLQIKFDPKILRLNDLVRGNLFSSDGQQPIFSKNIMNDAGEATVNLSRLPGTAGVSGSGTLITLVFQAVGRGDTTVTIPNLTLRNSKSQPLATVSPRLVINVK
jgi:general secretion pathway protein D